MEQIGTENQEWSFEEELGCGLIPLTENKRLISHDLGCNLSVWGGDRHSAQPQKYFTSLTKN